MRYWWVNQNQTYRHEVPGNYLWSPKRKANGDRNPFYDFMREVAPGDVVFSFADTLIRAVGIANSHAYEAPKPRAKRSSSLPHPSAAASVLARSICSAGHCS